MLAILHFIRQRKAKMLNTIKRKINFVIEDENLIIDFFFFFIFQLVLLICIISFYFNSKYWRDVSDTITMVAAIFLILIILTAIVFYFSRYKKYYQYVFIFPFTVYSFLMFFLSSYENIPVQLALMLITLCFALTKSKVLMKLLFILFIFIAHLIVVFLQTNNHFVWFKDHAVDVPFKGITINLVLLAIFLFIYLLLEHVKVKKKNVINQKFLFGLTETEKMLIPYLFSQKSYREIGNEIFRSPRTIETHAANIYRKLNVKNRMELKNRYKTD